MEPETVKSIFVKRITSLSKDDSGIALVLSLSFFLFIFILICGVYHVGNTINERIKLQNACDAAAYSAAQVQADSLSRMAVVNKAMAWTYIQMLKRQEDYITYRWLRLTWNNFKEDYQEAKDWHYCVPIYIIDLKFKRLYIPFLWGGNCNKKHNDETVGWWCGLGAEGHKNVRLNGKDYSMEDIETVLTNASSVFDKNPQSFNFFSGSKNESGGATSTYDTSRIGKLSNEYETLEQKKQTLNQENDQQELEKIQQRQQEINKELDDIQLQYDNQINDAKAKANQQSNSATQTSQSTPQSEYDTWGDKLKGYIESDMDNITYMSGALTTIFENSYRSQQKTIRHVLLKSTVNVHKNASGGFDVDDSVWDDYYFYYSVPYNQSPYLTDKNLQSNSMFLPLLNIESHERIFMQMATGEVKDTHLEHILDYDGYEKTAGGFEQWHVRGSDSCRAEDSGSFEKMAGICRTYKNTSFNEGHGGMLLKEFYRGNHMVEFFDKAGSFQTNFKIKTGIGGIFEPIVNALVSKIANNLVSSVVNNLMKGANSLIDMSPSCANSPDFHNAMCKKITDSNALYSEYRWASAKWYCINRNGRWESHLPIAKYWCGEGKSLGVDFLPIPDVRKKGHMHGYSETPGSFADVYQPISNFMSKSGNSREEYWNCAVTPDNKEYPLWVRGHERIYGDDQKIFNHIYETKNKNGVQVKAMPWILAPNFFNRDEIGETSNSGNGTICVGFAKRLRNPFLSYMYSILGKSKKETRIKNGIYSAFDPADKANDKDNFMWTMSAARAVYKHPKTKKYMLTFDDPCFKYLYQKQGCICDTVKANKKELMYAWNLTQTDWTASLLPVVYGRATITTENGLPVWNKLENGVGESLLYESMGPNQNGLVGKWMQLSYDGDTPTTDSAYEANDILNIRDVSDKYSTGSDLNLDNVFYQRKVN